MTTSKFIGKGIVFPIQLNSNGRPDIVEDTSIIISSIKIILNWALGERFFNEKFGSRIFELLEEPNDSITRSLINTFIVDALEKHEKRIQLKKLSIVNHDSEKVSIELIYMLRNSKIEQTYIFPYYKSLS